MSQNTTSTPQQLQRFHNKVCIVTASTAGIGFAIAKRLAEEGGKVVICSRKNQNVETAKQQLLRIVNEKNLLAIECNVSKEVERKRLIDETVKKFGNQIDVLVSNNATSLSLGETIDTEEKAFDKMFESNVKAAFMLRCHCFRFFNDFSTVF